MADLDNNKNVAEEEEELNVVVLVDEDTGEELTFAVIDEAELDGKLYYALVPADEEEPEEYLIFSVTKNGEDVMFETVDDEDEADKVEDFFNDRFFGEIDYDQE